MSATAPTLFGTTSTTSTSSTTKTTNPFSGVSLVSSNTKSPAASSSSYPPMSATAPTPFGATSRTGTSTTPQSTQTLPTTQLKASDDAGADSYRNRLIAFYKIHNPSRLDTADATLEKYKGKEEEMFRKLEAKYVKVEGGNQSKFPHPSGDGPLCYLEFAVDGKSIGRVVVKLYKDKAPLATENFRCLCTGEITRQRHLYYLGSNVHRIVPGFCIQMGDFTRGDGRGGMSIYQPNTEQ
eukprot:scaffold3618_cov129-Cylindrotheca_fusiformis.AAC.1